MRKVAKFEIILIYTSAFGIFVSRHVNHFDLITGSTATSPFEKPPPAVPPLKSPNYAIDELQ